MNNDPIQARETFMRDHNKPGFRDDDVVDFHLKWILGFLSNNGWTSKDDHEYVHPNHPNHYIWIDVDYDVDVSMFDKTGQTVEDFENEGYREVWSIWLDDFEAIFEFITYMVLGNFVDHHINLPKN